MKRTKEVTDYEDRFGEEVFDILAVTGASGFGGGKVPKEEYWTASIGLTAWKREGASEVTQGEFRLTAKADEAYLAKLRGSVGIDQVIRVKVRSDGKDFLIVELLGSASDLDLEKVLEEQTRVVTYVDEVLGAFTLERTVNWFEAELNWMGQPVRLNFDRDEEVVMQEELDTARRLWENEKEWDQKVRRYAASELLELKNESWIDEDEAELTAEEFMKRMELESISVAPEGVFEFWFADDDMFWGHTIYVSGSMEEGPSDASIAG